MCLCLYIIMLQCLYSMPAWVGQFNRIRWATGQHWVDLSQCWFGFYSRMPSFNTNHNTQCTGCLYFMASALVKPPNNSHDPSTEWECNIVGSSFIFTLCSSQFNLHLKHSVPIQSNDKVHKVEHLDISNNNSFQTFRQGSWSGMAWGRGVLDTNINRTI